jgi:SAM-dependent methyltransferase
VSRLGGVLGILRIAGFAGLRRLQANAGSLKKYVRPYAVIDCLAALEEVGLLAKLCSGEVVDINAQPEVDRAVLETVVEYLFENDLLRRTGSGRYAVRDPRRFEVTLDALYACLAYREPGHAMGRLLGRQSRYGRDVARSDRYDAIASATLTSKFSYGFARRLIQRSGADSLLDIGCGTGQFLSYLAEQGFTGKLYGMDHAEDAIAAGKAEQRQRDNVQLFVGDALRLRDSAERGGVRSVALVSFMFVLHEFDDQMVKAVLASIAEAFPQAGILLIELIDRTSDELRSTRETTVFPELKLVHRLSNQILRTKEQWVSLLAASGYGVAAQSRNDIANHVGFIFARGRDASAARREAHDGG